jgi:uncharacterized membrane protein
MESSTAGRSPAAPKKTARLLGHHIHPMLVVFPLGLLGGAVAFDTVWLTNRESEFATVAYWLLGAGLIGGVAAAVFGFWDWRAIPEGTRAKRIGGIHGITQAIALVLFYVSWFMRRNNSDLFPDAQALTASYLGLAVAMFGGWLGGELVERLGVGVDPRAHLDAPNSLTPDTPSGSGPIGGATIRPR